MNSVAFETVKYKILITGNTVWIETKEGSEWVLKGQQNLPVSPEELRGDGDVAVLREALQYFERTRGGDASLRHMLTGRRTGPFEPGRAVPKPAKDKSSRSRPLRAVDSFRAPLRPPLALAHSQ
jgi:hypothetical protein